MNDNIPKHWTPKRVRFGWHIQPAFKKYTSLVGEVTWASNHLHGELLWILGVIFPSMSEEDGSYFYSDYKDMAEEMWHSLKSDDAQRAVLRAVVKHSKMLATKERNSILWVISAAGRLSEYRNDAIHTEFDLHWDSLSDSPKLAKFLPGDAANPKRAEKLERVGHIKLFKALIGDLNQLADYLAAISLNVMNRKAPKRPALPKRPVLQSLLLVQKSPPKPSNPEPQIRVRRRQRRPSKG